MQNKLGNLDGVTVIDLTHMLSGPFSTMMLADHGAKVIKIERPGEGDAFREGPPFVEGMSHQFAAVNRGKHSLALDIQKPEGIEILKKLLETADVLVNNFRPGKLEKLGLSYEEVKKINPKIIYATITGFGKDSSMAHKPAFDPVIQAQAGLMALTGEPGGAPLRAGLSWADLLGGVFCFQGVVSALFHRERTGQGQEVEVSMFDSIFFMLSYFVPYFQSSGKNPMPQGPFHQTLVPVGTYPTKDSYIALAPVTQSFWRSMCKGLGKDEWIHDPKFAEPGNRQKHREELCAAICEITRTKTTQEWAKIMEEQDMPSGAILRISDLMSHPLVEERNLLASLGWGELSSPISPFKLSENIQKVSKPAPVVGEDNNSILNSLGFSDEFIHSLKSKKVI